MLWSIRSKHVYEIARLFERIAKIDEKLSKEARMSEAFGAPNATRGPGWPLGSVSAKKGRPIGSGGKRSQRGQNLAKVTAFLKSQSNGATQADIARNTGLNPAIVSLLVKRHSELLRKAKGRGGLIRLGR